MIRRVSALACCLCALLGFAAQSIGAQEKGLLVLTVLTPDGSPVEGGAWADLTMKDEFIASERTLPDGTAQLAAPLSPYTLTVGAGGYYSQTLDVSSPGFPRRGDNHTSANAVTIVSTAFF